MTIFGVPKAEVRGLFTSVRAEQADLAGLAQLLDR